MSEAIEAKLDGLTRAMESGFARVHKDLDEVKVDLKHLNGEGLPRRVRKLENDAEQARGEGLPRRLAVLETWKDRVSARWSAMVSAVVVAVIGAWVAALLG